MRELQSRGMILLKGAMFLLLAAGSAYLLLEPSPTTRVALLLALLAWSSARFYYFLFYVLERHVDPDLRYTGIAHLVVTLFRRARPRRGSGA